MLDHFHGSESALYVRCCYAILHLVLLVCYIALPHNPRCEHTQRVSPLRWVPYIHPDQLTRRYQYFCVFFFFSVTPWPPSPPVTPSSCKSSVQTQVHPSSVCTHPRFAWRLGNVQHDTTVTSFKKRLASPETLHLWLTCVCYHNTP